MNLKRIFLGTGGLIAIGAGLLLLSNKLPKDRSPQTTVRVQERNLPAVAAGVSNPVVAPERPASKSSLKQFGSAWKSPESELTTAHFANWWEKYRAASANEKSALEKEGLELVAQRRAALAKLIQTDPERALENAIPFSVRTELPDPIRELIEERISGRGDLSVFGVLPEPGKESEVVSTFRTASIGGKEFKAFAYGRRLGEPTKNNIPLNGIAIGTLLAVNENPVRILEPAEADQITKTSEALCAVSGDVTTSRQEETAVDVGGEIIFLCQIAHADDLNRQILEADTTAEGDVSASAYTEGQKKLILIRVDFPDLIGAPFSDTTGTNLISGLNGFYSESSYGKASFAPVGEGSDYTPTFRMPTNASYYGTNDFYNRLRTDARNAAAAAGYVLANYNFDLICMKSVPGFNWAGLGYVGAPGAWIRNSFGTGVSAHELGHNFGLNHANFWNTSGASIIGTNGTNVEYGDSFDTMGAANAGNNHFNARYKRYLNWLATNEVTTVITSGTYRIFCHDNTNSTGVRALSVAKNGSTNYWVEFRQKFSSNKWLMSGAGLRWAQSGNQKSLLLDTTPGSPDGKNDAALVIGRTFSDKGAGVHITPIRKGGTVPESLDVVVNKGTFSANVPPAISIVTSATNVSSGGIVNFTAVTSDANGDALAYYWDFGDKNFGTNGATASKSWTTGEYVVRCTASDMKGGVASDSVVVRVGSPTTYRVSGKVMTNSAPIEGVRVYASSTLVTYTDSDGTYNLVGLPAGSYTVNASLDGYTFVHPTFSNPISVGPSATGINFNTSSVMPPAIASHPQSKAVVAGSNVTFSVTASGGTPFTYRWMFNGATVATTTSSIFTVLNAQSANAGNYSVLVSNVTGIATSSNAMLAVNVSPAIAAISDRTVAENTLLAFGVVATDSNALAYALDSGAPAGASIDAGSGVFDWAPTEAQGPGIYNIAVRVTDNGIPAASSTSHFTVTVTESNSAPVLAIVSNQFVNAGATLVFTNLAGDPDLPANTLTFAFGSNALAGATIDPGSGILNWTAPNTDVLLTNLVSIQVSDNGSPSLTDVMNFEVVVVPLFQVSESALSPEGLLTLKWPTFPGKTYQLQFKTDLENPEWINDGTPIVANDVSVSVTRDPLSHAQRFFRIVQLD